MNYLAHAFLSPIHQPMVLMGNMMGDYIKGSQYLQFSAEVQQGILLHRHIDTFTDAHPTIREAKIFFRPYYGLYSGALVDVMWDYFLANDKQFFATETDLQIFTKNIYTTLQSNEALQPEKMKPLINAMIQYDWLYNYRLPQGIHSSWKGMSKRLPHLADAQEAIQLFKNHQTEFEQMYKVLMQDLRKEFVL